MFVDVSLESIYIISEGINFCRKVVLYYGLTSMAICCAEARTQLRTNARTLIQYELTMTYALCQFLNVTYIVHCITIQHVFPFFSISKYF